MRQLFLLFLICCPFIVKSQSRLEQPEMYLGTSHGVSGSMVLFKPSVAQSYLLGYNGGIVFRYIAEKNVGMQLEMNYFQRGWKEKTNQYQRQLHYLEMPFMTHIYVGKENRAFLNMGPKISYLMAENETKENILIFSEVQQIRKVQNKFDYGLCAGIGCYFNIQKSVLQLETRANFGLSDIFSNKKTDFFDTSNNTNLSVNLGWFFRIK